jgi:hypothetical protein
MRDVRFRFGLAAAVLGFVTAIAGAAGAQGATEPPVEQQPSLPAPAPAQPPPPTDGAVAPATVPPAITGAPTEPTPPATVTPPPPVPSRGVEMHDGFYFRAGLGFGSLFGKVTLDVEDAEDVSVSGFSLLSELAFGGTLGSGIVVGGGIYTSSTGTTSYEVDAGNATVSFDGGSTTVGVLGPFVDVYPNPEMGLHFGGALGFGVITADEGDEDDEFYFPPDKYSGVGFGLMLQGGYEVFVADQWSIGGAARLLYARATLKPDDDESSEDVKAGVLVPGALFTVTYH